MTSKIHYLAKATWGGGRFVAFLMGPDRWVVMVDGQRDPEFEHVLSEQYRDRFNLPQDGYYGRRIMADLADVMGAEVEFAPVNPPGPKELY